MSEPQPFEDIPFNEGLDAIPVSQERQMCFQVTRDGVFEGLVVHVELDLDVDRILSSSNYVTNGSHCSWDQIFVMTKERTQAYPLLQNHLLDKVVVDLIDLART